MVLRIRRTPLRAINSIKAVCGVFYLLSVLAPLHAQQAQAWTEGQEEAAILKSSFFRRAANVSIFIYGPQAIPCATQPARRNLPPLGSGFVVHLEIKTPASSPQQSGWNFLVTAKHLIANQPEFIVRVPSKTASHFVCHSLDLRNAVFATSGVDLVALSLPEIPGADLTVIPSSLLIDAKGMIEQTIGIGTDVLTVGYLLDFEGQMPNTPTAKFARISLLTEKWWYHNPQSHRFERGYALDLSSALELSGAPVFASGLEVATYPFTYRELQPFVLGVVKGLILTPVKDQFLWARGAVIEPGENLKTLIQQIAKTLQDANIEPDISQNTPMPELR